MQKDLTHYVISSAFALFSLMTAIIGGLIRGKLKDIESDNQVLAERLDKTEGAWADNLKELTAAIQQLQISISKLESTHGSVVTLEAKVEKLSAKVIKLETILEK